MRLTRCFVAVPLASDTTVSLSAAASAHLAKVLRLRVGAALTLFDGRSGEFEAEIVALERDGVRVRVGAHRVLERESPVAVTLLQCLARGERMDWIVQKATELGAVSIVPVISEHSVVRLDESAAQRRQQHWQSVAISACEQCGRNRVPAIKTPAAFERACLEAHSAGARLLLEPEGAQSLASVVNALAASTSVSVLIGPEGGLSAQELAIAQRHGFIGCHLGPRILRAETAPLAALATIQALLGDFSG
jgi:16S rRNA (uracil1498-N3)-methyltransferase